MTTVPFGHTVDEIDSSGSRHTAREILQQPGVWRELAANMLSQKEEFDSFLRRLLDRSEVRIILTGAGTSAFAGEILAPTLARQLQRRVDAIATTDIVSNPREHFAGDIPTLLVSFSRSGDSPESIAATNLADQCLSEVHHIAVTCNPDGELYRRYSNADDALALLMPEQTNDQGFAMTSSVTCMMLATMLTLGVSERKDGLVEKLATAAEYVLEAFARPAREISERGYERIIYLGSGALTGLARESALKLLELTAGAIVTYFDSALGFRHGPKSVLNDRTLALVYLSNDSYTRQYDLDIAAELRDALGQDNVMIIGAKKDDEDSDSNAFLIDGVGDTDDSALALPFVVCAQMIGLHFSLALGKTPDNPFPSGEVNRVVQGVTIHSLPKR